jgi:NAD-dependent DNA ligase
MNASNRQKKLLTFFGVLFSPDISTGAAGWEIEAILSDERNRERWRRYLYLTRDFGSDSPLPLRFNSADLENIVIPDDWNESAERQKIFDETVSQAMSDGSPFDNPQPEVIFRDRRFVFTGKFDFGTREACRIAVTELGGISPAQKHISREIDFLVIGSCGSKAWKRGSYGNKIEAAIISRREHGTPAIISGSTG